MCAVYDVLTTTFLPNLAKDTDLLPWNLSYKTHLCRQETCWSFRCSWSIACQRCSKYVFILHWSPGVNGLGKGNCKTRDKYLSFRILCVLYQRLDGSFHEKCGIGFQKYEISLPENGASLLNAPAGSYIWHTVARTKRPPFVDHILDSLSSRKMFVFWFKFHWNLFSGVNWQ